MGGAWPFRANSGESALSLAAACGKADMVELLLNCKAVVGLCELERFRPD